MSFSNPVFDFNYPYGGRHERTVEPIELAMQIAFMQSDLYGETPTAAGAALSVKGLTFFRIIPTSPPIDIEKFIVPMDHNRALAMALAYVDSDRADEVEPQGVHSKNGPDGGIDPGIRIFNSRQTFEICTVQKSYIWFAK